MPFGVIAKRELSTGTRYAADNTTWDAYNHQYNMRFSLNYVTGTHSFKVGMQDMWGTRNYTAFGTQAQDWDFNMGVPARIFQYARPLEDLQKLRAALGIYAQDRWTIDRVTLNLGIRYDFHEAYVPAQTTAELLFVPSTTYAEVADTPSWRDLSPRMGCRLGRVGHRADRAARQLRALRRQRVRGHGHGEQPGEHAHQRRRPHVERREPQLPPRLRSHEPRGERRVAAR